jgi:hypothetical protein
LVVGRREEKVGTPAVPSDIGKLKMPEVGQAWGNSSAKGRKANSWDMQTYADFASKLEKLNPGEHFDKKREDDALRRRVRRDKGFGKAKVVPAQDRIDRTLQRVSLMLLCRLVVRPCER